MIEQIIEIDGRNGSLTDSWFAQALKEEIKKTGLNKPVIYELKSDDPFKEKYLLIEKK